MKDLEGTWNNLKQVETGWKNLREKNERTPNSGSVTEDRQSDWYCHKLKIPQNCTNIAQSHKVGMETPNKLWDI